MNFQKYLFCFFLSKQKSGCSGRPAFSFLLAGFTALFLLLFFLCFFTGCTMTPKKHEIRVDGKGYPPGSVIRTSDLQVVAFEEMMEVLSSAEIVYAGERHVNPGHHSLQLKIMKNLYRKHPDMKVGMEMFDHTYQDILDQWSSGRLSREELLEKTHWYANWKYDFSLYSDILHFIKKHGIPVICLNIPGHIPDKIAVGGIKNLSPEEKSHLPENIEPGGKAHREYLRSVFKHHHQPGLDNFQYFYQAQCAWEEAMAGRIAGHAGDVLIMVVAGAGHIKHGWGIPERVHRKNPASYKTVLPLAAGRKIDPGAADYILATEPAAKMSSPSPR